MHAHLLSTLQSLHISSAETQTAVEVPVWCPEHRKCHRCWLCYQATMLKDMVTATAPLVTLNRHLSETDGMGLQMLNISSLEYELYTLASI
jgi:hypothetical protein